MREHIVLGAARTGTHMVTRVLDALGVDMGLRACDDNGEHLVFTETDRAIMNELGQPVGDKNGRLLVDAQPTEWTNGLCSKQVENYRTAANGKPWGWKCGTTIFTFPCYEPFLEEPALIITHRNPWAAARSQEKLMTALHLPNVEGPLTRQEVFLRVVQGAYLAIFTLLERFNYLPRVHVSYEAMLEAPIPGVHALATALGLEPKDYQIREAIDVVDRSKRHWQ